MGLFMHHSMQTYAIIWQWPMQAPSGRYNNIILFIVACWKASREGTLVWGWFTYRNGYSYCLTPMPTLFIMYFPLLHNTILCMLKCCIHGKEPGDEALSTDQSNMPSWIHGINMPPMHACSVKQFHSQLAVNDYACMANYIHGQESHPKRAPPRRYS